MNLPQNLTIEEYDAMRPYRDDEINAAMRRIVASPHFPLLASYVYPAQSVDSVASFLKSISSIDEFQLQVMAAVNEQIISRSISQFTFSGFEALDPQERYLFVSNHRDIMLDSSLLQYALWKSGHPTSEITFGANLMSDPTVIDIGKSNKMFRVERGGSMRDFYRSSLKLSSYIRHTICLRRQSVWIAQRNGRTKDGLDHTEPGLVNMFACSRPDDRVEALAELNIVPVAISYEWETCDLLKTRELALRAGGSPYIKAPDEDLRSILHGILEPKGRVHIALGPLLSRAELHQFDSLSRSDYARAVANLIDSRIYSAYHPWPSNYVAADIEAGNTANFDQGRYTAADLHNFNQRLATLSSVTDASPELLHDIFVGIYANPVKTHPD